MREHVINYPSKYKKHSVTAGLSPPVCGFSPPSLSCVLTSCNMYKRSLPPLTVLLCMFQIVYMLSFHIWIQLGFEIFFKNCLPKQTFKSRNSICSRICVLKKRKIWFLYKYSYISIHFNNKFFIFHFY